MSAITIEERARRYVGRIPPAVSGSSGHDQTFAAACSLIKGFALTIDEARPLLREYNATCQPPWSEREIEHKLTSADRAPDEQPRGWLVGENAGPDYLAHRPTSAPAPATAPRPGFSAEKLATFAGSWREKATLPWLANRSRYEAAMVGTADFLSELYEDGENVLVFLNQQTQGECLWPRDELPVGGDRGVWFLAQPVDGKSHPNPRTGNMSRRSEESVLHWRYLVIESDVADMQTWMGALVQLPLRIAAIYTSGKRSIHALVRLDVESKAEWDQERDAMKEPLVVLGADPKSLSAVRLTRLPGCWRGNRLQKLLYINPEPRAVPICELPALRDGVGTV